MQGEVVFFSLNKKEDWQRGIIFDLDIRDCGLVLKDEQEKERKDSMSKGTFISLSFDSLQNETVWRRVTSEYKLTGDAYVNISYFAQDSKLIEVDGSPVNLDSFIAGMGMSDSEKIAKLEKLFKKNTMSNTSDALFMDAVGRYLWLKVDIIGNMHQSPVLGKIRLFPDNGSYLQYLPEIFQEDRESKEFLERYLSIFQSFFMDMEEKIEHVSNYFDPATVTDEFLDWLADCVGIENKNIWSGDKLRRLVENAYHIYKKKGTREGLEKIVAHYTGEKPIIIEYFQYSDFLGSEETREILVKLYGDNPYVFNVFVRQEAVPDIESSTALSEIINGQKPAHTEGRLIVLKPNICLDSYTFLGINTYLTEQSVLKLDNNTSLPYNTILVD